MLEDELKVVREHRAKDRLWREKNHPGFQFLLQAAEKAGKEDRDSHQQDPMMDELESPTEEHQEPMMDELESPTEEHQDIEALAPDDHAAQPTGDDQAGPDDAAEREDIAAEREEELDHEDS